MAKQLGVRCPRGEMPWSECHRCRLNPLRPCQYTPDILQMIERHNVEEHKPNAYTPSRMVGCDRQAVLMTEHDYYESLSGGWAAVRGTMIHSTLEAGGEVEGYVQTMREIRLSTQLETEPGEHVEITQDFSPGDNSITPGSDPFNGKPDLILVTRRVLPEFAGEPAQVSVKLVDYKTSSVGHDLIRAKIEHMMQVNVYKWLIERELARHLGGHIVVTVEELEIIYLAYDRIRRFTSAGALHDRGKLIDRKKHLYETLTLAPIPMLSTATVEAWLKKRIRQKKDAFVTLPPVLTGERARWCNYCSIREKCYAIAREESRDKDGV